MPTVKQIGPYSFKFYNSDQPEPPHIHVRRDKLDVKFWPDPVELAGNHGFRSHEINRIEHLVIKHQQEFVEAWHDYFAT